MWSRRDERNIATIAPTDPIDLHRVVIMGGGMAALEAVLALRDLVGTRVCVTVIAPESDFAPAGGLGLERFMSEQGGRFRRTATLGVDPDLRRVRCVTGTDEPYDTLIVAVGASSRPAFEHSLTLGADFPALNGLVADLERGSSRSVAFLVPEACSWPLPLYELALMTADEVSGLRMGGVELHLVTPELSPLDILGPHPSAAVAELLQAARITLHTGVSAAVHQAGHVETGSGAGLDVERVVALPILDGPRLAGLPSDAGGFLPVDEFGRVVGVHAVYAAGDATDRPIKQGTLACRQADAVAAHVARAAGAAVDAAPYDAVLSGRLLTGHSGRFLPRAETMDAGEAVTKPLWWPPMKVSGHYLGPYLEDHDLVVPPLREEVNGGAIDVRLPLRS